MSYTDLASAVVVKKTKLALEQKGYRVRVVDTKEAALETIKSVIPNGASVTKGASTTLDQIGLIDYLKSSNHGWNNLAEKVLSESDPIKQLMLRRQSTVADYYVGSVHALTEAGEFLVASNTASQIPSLVYNASNLVLVVGTHKIVADMNSAMDRLHKHVVPLEDERMQKEYGMGTNLSKILWFLKEAASSKRKIYFILVNAVLGF